MSQAKHSRRVKGWTLLETNVLQTAAVWHQIPQHRTLAPELRRHGFIHHQPSNPLSFRPPLSPSLTPHFVFFQIEGEGGREEGKRGEREGGANRGAVTVLSSCSSFSFFVFFFFEDVLCSFFFLLFFFFLIEKYYCSSLPSVCNLLIIPRLSDADHSVVVNGDD